MNPTMPAMFEWSDEQLMVRDAVRRFVADEIKPNLEQLEHGDLPPYDILRKMVRLFGMDAMARESFRRQSNGKGPDPPAGQPPWTERRADRARPSW